MRQNVALTPCSRSRSRICGVYVGSGPSSKVSATADEPVRIWVPSGPDVRFPGCSDWAPPDPPELDALGCGLDDVDSVAGLDGRRDDDVEVAGAVDGDEGVGDRAGAAFARG